MGPFRNSFVVLAFVSMAALSGCGRPPDTARHAGESDTDFARRMRPIAEQDDADAEVNLSLAYYYGRGVPRDYRAAAEWLRRAAKRGNAHAQNDLGVAYVNGQGVPQDYHEATVWFAKAAEQGNASAQGNLGVAYENGQGVPQNYQRSHMWFNLAAAQGQPNAAANRDAVAARMNAEQVGEAQAMALRCAASAYKDCE